MEIETHIPVLEAAQPPEMAAAALAAIEFTLASSIIVRDAADIKSAVHWSGLVEPFRHQVQNLITFCRLGPVQLISDDVGMGKTISAGLIISELMVRKRVGRVLVLAPKILLPQWKAELTSKFRLQADFGTGQRLSQLISNDTQVVITTYASALKRIDALANADFDMLVLDEAHKLRNLFGASKVPRIATAIKRVTSDTAFQFTLLLSATPIQNRLWDLYSLVDIMSGARGHENPLGSPRAFSDRYLSDKVAARSIKTSEVARFRRIVSEYAVRTTRLESGLSFPERKVETWRCEATGIENRLEALLRTHLPHANPLQRVNLAIALMSSPAAFAKQIGNPKNQANVRQSVIDEVQRIAESSPLGCKAKRLFELIDGLRAQKPNSWHTVIFTRRKATQRALGKALKARGARVGYIGGDYVHRQDNDILKYQENPPRVNVLISTDTGAEGVNLQSGNIVVNYDLPWNPMVLEQRIGRVQRLGSEHSNVIVTNLVVEGSVEELVVARLMERLQLISRAIGDIEGILGVLNRDEDVEEQIKNLVLLALAGKDVRESRQRIEESINRAKRLYDESQSLMIESLGTSSLDSLHHAGPDSPDIKPVNPRMAVRDLVKLHFASRGDVTEMDDGRLRLLEDGIGIHFATFDPADPNLRAPSHESCGRPTRLYAEGQSIFERIIGTHSAKRLHSLSPRDLPKDHLYQVTSDWVQKLSPLLTWTHTSILTTRLRLTGSITALASCSNAVDRLQRLVRAESPTSGWLGDEVPDSPAAAHAISRWHAAIRTKSLTRDSYPEPALAALQSAVQGDSSLRAFNDFYLARLSLELQKAGASPDLTRRLTERFTPRTTAELVSAEGTLEKMREVVVRYRYDNGPEARTVLLLGGQGEILSGPTLAECQLTGGHFPESDLSACGVTGVQALSHLMVTSSVSGVRMLPEAAVVCAFSGDILLPTEAVLSAFSSRPLAPRNVVACAVTGLLAAIDEVAACEFTGSMAHESRLAISQVSGQRYRTDQRACSAMSGTAGHITEFVVCELSGALVLPEEASISDASGKLVKRDLLIPSQKNPSRLATQQEMMRCAVTDRLLLPDETGVSEVSGLIVDSLLLLPSSWSGRLGLQDELVTCEVSGERLLPTEAWRSEISSRWVSPNHATKCAVTGKVAASDEVDTCEFTCEPVLLGYLAVSQVSGRRYRTDQEGACAVSGVIGHISEFLTCAISGDSVLPQESAPSSVSGKPIRKDLLVRSDRDASRLAAPEEMFRCAVSGAHLMPDEVGRSAISGLVVDNSLLFPSAFSNALALATELFVCEESGTHVLPSETATCEQSGMRTRLDLLGVSDISGKCVLKRLLCLCPETGLWGLESEFVRCEESGLLVAPGAAGTCTVSGKTVVSRLLVHCEECRTPLLRSMAVVTVAGEAAHPHHTVISPFTGRRYLRQSLERCQATGLLVEPQFMHGSISKPISVTSEKVRSEKPAHSPQVDKASDLLKKLNPPIRASRLWFALTPNDRLIAVIAERRRLFHSPDLFALYLDLESELIVGEIALVGHSGVETIFVQLVDE